MWVCAVLWRTQDVFVGGVRGVAVGCGVGVGVVDGGCIAVLVVVRVPWLPLRLRPRLSLYCGGGRGASAACPPVRVNHMLGLVLLVMTIRIVSLVGPPCLGRASTHAAWRMLRLFWLGCMLCPLTGQIMWQRGKRS